MKIKVALIVEDSMSRVWECWTQEKHIKEWYHALDNWYVPSAKIDFKESGKFKINMADMSKSGSLSFAGIYTSIKKHKEIHFTIDDGRKVIVTFEAVEKGVLIIEEFEATSTQPPAAQEMGWQLILKNFKNYVEN